MPDTKSSKLENKTGFWVTESVKDKKFEEYYEIVSELSRFYFSLLYPPIKLE